MKKQGYTLAEVLVTLGIIGILAAIMLPMANKFRPDSTKVMYLNTYDTLVNTLNSVLNNEDLYPTVLNNTNYSLTPLFNNSAATVEGNSIQGGVNKLCNALGYAFQGNMNAGACKNTYKLPNAAFAPDFTTQNQVQFMVSRILTLAGGTLYYRTDIDIDIDGNEGNNCLYDANNCPNPDRFKFYVGVNGKIVPADPMGKHYLETRTNLKAQKDVAIDSTEITFPDDMKQAGKQTLKDLRTDIATSEMEAEILDVINTLEPEISTTTTTEITTSVEIP